MFVGWRWFWIFPRKEKRNATLPTNINAFSICQNLNRTGSKSRKNPSVRCCYLFAIERVATYDEYIYQGLWSLAHGIRLFLFKVYFSGIRINDLICSKWILSMDKSKCRNIYMKFWWLHSLHKTRQLLRVRWYYLCLFYFRWRQSHKNCSSSYYSILLLLS